MVDKRLPTNQSLRKNRNFILLWSAQVVSAFGDPFGTVALSWMVYSLTGSVLAIGELWLAFLVPQIITRVLAGPLVDRLEHRSLMVVSDLVRALAYGAPLLLILSNKLSVWHLYVLSAVEGTFAPLFQLASMALLPGLVTPAQLVRANAVSQGATQLALMIGPATAGAAVAVLGGPAALLIDAISFLISGLVLAFLPIFGRVSLRNGNWLEQFREGLRFFTRHRVLVWLAAFVAVSNFCWQAAYVMLLPYIKDTLRASATTFGLVNSAASAGYIVGTWMLTLLGNPRWPRLTLIGALGAIGLVTLLIAWARVPETLIMLMFSAGLFAPFFNVPVAAFYQQLVPDDLRGRVFAVRLLLAQAANPLGVLAGSAVGEVLGPSAVFISAGVLPMASSLLAYMLPSFRALDALGHSSAGKGIAEDSPDGFGDTA